MSKKSSHGMSALIAKREFQKRLRIFAENLFILIKAIEACLKKPKHKRIRLGITSLSHLSDDEFRKMLNPKLMNKLHSSMNDSFSGNLTGIRGCRNEPILDRIPEKFNWVAKGKVTPIRNQEKCGCCFIFSAVATVESSLLIKSR
ncbi:hypothetical protein BLA29_012582, partial [Euroglyphus maynei]